MDEKHLSLGRFESAAGWDPGEPFRKQRDKVKANQELEERRTRPILHAPHTETRAPAGDLFSTLWRTGEVALLFGAPGVGKSIFAVCLAEAIALRKPARSKGIESRRVVYVDLQRTEPQFNQRFPDASIERRHFDWNLFDADDTDNIRAARVHASIYEAIEDGVDVVILDDITLGGINIGRPLGALRTLRTLKMFAAERGTSFLVIAGARPHKLPRAASLSDVTFRHIADQADSVFCLAASTYGPAFRYIRHLRASSAPIIHDASAVLTYQLSSVSSPSVNAVASSDLIPDSPLTTHPSPLDFRFLGTCDESEHLRDYAAEALRAEREKEHQCKRALNRTNKDFLIEGILDGSYQKYLNGK